VIAGLKHGNRYLFISTMFLYLFLDAFLQLHGGQTILKHSACPATGFRNDS